MPVVRDGLRVGPRLRVIYCISCSQLRAHRFYPPFYAMMNSSLAWIHGNCLLPWSCRLFPNPTLNTSRLFEMFITHMIFKGFHKKSSQNLTAKDRLHMSSPLRPLLLFGHLRRSQLRDIAKLQSRLERWRRLRWIPTMDFNPNQVDEWRTMKNVVKLLTGKARINSC